MADKHAAEKVLTLLRQNWPEAANSTSELMMRVYRLNDLVRANANRQAERHGLSFTEFEILVALRSAGRPYELTPTDLYQAVLISSGGLTKALYCLEELGFVTRNESRSDKRSKPVRLTKAGRITVERAMMKVLASDGKLLGKGLNAIEIVTLTGLVAKFLSALEPTGDNRPASSR